MIRTERWLAPFDDLRDICIPLERCVSVRLEKVDPTILDELKHKGYDQAPVLESREKVLGIVQTKELERLNTNDLPLVKDNPAIDHAEISSKSSLDELFSTFSSKRVVIVVTGDRPSGLLTISDLNKHPLRSILYLILAELEAGLAEFILNRCPDPEEWIPHLSAERRVQVLGYWEVTKRFRVDTGPLSACTLADLISILTKPRVSEKPLATQATAK